ncbi:putative lipoprotein [Vibrio cholerae]|nr:putative lipoprotein [Vibrio cholerae]
MKKSLMVLTVMIALVGCDDATKAIDEAQAAANKAVDNLQQKADSLNLQDLNLDVLGDATQKAQEFTQSIDSLIKTDFTDHQAVVAATEKKCVM